MAGTEVRPVGGLLARRAFVDLPFRLHGHDPAWVPPLRYAVYDRLSSRHPARSHQRWQLWTAWRGRQAVGRIAACRDYLFDEHQGERWAWVGFFECIDDPRVAESLFDVALDWSRRQGAEVAVGPGNFTTNDEIGLLVEGFEHPATVMTLENPRYYEALWVTAGWQPAMDLYGYQFTRPDTDLSERQRRALERLRERSKVTLRQMRQDDYEAEVSRFFEFYNNAWQHNWGYAPMPEAEVRHLARQLKPLLNPRWVFALEREGEVVGVCLTVPDVNQVMVRLRSGRLLPLGWARLLYGIKRVTNVRVLAMGIRPDVQHTGLGPLLYAEIVERLRDDGLLTAEASWTLATNFRINRQIEAMGAHRYKVWRLYQQRL
jgi:GNAT superfamily N-acetyltransferase